MNIEEILTPVRSELNRINQMIAANEEEAANAYRSYEYGRARQLYEIRQGLREARHSLEFILRTIKNPAPAGPAVASSSCDGATEPA